MTTKKIQIKNYNIDKMSDMKSMSVVLKDYIVKNKLYTPIIGKNYVLVDGWSFAGGMLGLFPKIVNVTNLSSRNEIKWMAEVEIVNKDGRIISKGYAVCSNKESKKRGFDEYAVLSMAQTRSISKAFRSTIGYIMKLSGFESTPSEEMSATETKEFKGKNLVSEAERMINASKSIETVISIGDRIEASKKFTAKEKSELVKLVGEKLNELENAKEKSKK